MSVRQKLGRIVVVLCIGITICVIAVTAYIAKERMKHKESMKQAGTGVFAEKDGEADESKKLESGASRDEELAQISVGDLTVEDWKASKKKQEELLKEKDAVISHTSVQPNIAWSSGSLSDISDVEILAMAVAQLYENELSDVAVEVSGVTLSEEELKLFPNQCHYYTDDYGYIYLNVKLLVNNVNTEDVKNLYVNCKLGYEGKELKMFEITDILEERKKR